MNDVQFDNGNTVQTNRRTRVVDPPLVPKEVPEPPAAAVSDQWFESEDYGLVGFKEEPIVQHARNLVGRARERVTRAHQSLTNRDPYFTEAQHLEDWEKRTRVAVKNLDEEQAKLDQQFADELRGLDQEINERLALKETERACEIRNYVRSIPEDQRHPFISEVVNRGDSETVAALISAPGYLSGISEDQRGNLKERYMRTHAKDLVERREAIEKAHKAAYSAHQAVTGYVKSIRPEDSFKRIEAMKERAAKARGDLPRRME